jgi:hypothetical protein
MSKFNYNNYKPEFTDDDFLFYKNGDVIMSGGYSIDSLLLKEGISPMQTFNSLENGGNLIGGNKPSNIFENLAVPAGLLFINKKNIGSYSSLSDYKETKMLPDNIFDEFMSMIEMDKRKRKKTRRNDVISSKKKTRKM